MATRDQDGTRQVPERDDGGENRDPISDERGAHPVGTGIGAAAGGASGAAIGAAAGPAGVIVGAAVGVVAGGLGGRAAAEAVSPTLEDGYWREAYKRRPYAASGSAYEEYRPAYKFGWEARLLYRDRRWDEVEAELGERWNESREGSTLRWEQARDAAQDAWHRLSHRAEDAQVDPVLDLETSESNLDRPDRRLDTTDASGSPDAGADQRRKGETLH